MSEKLTPERIAEIMALPVVYDEDCPKLTKEQIARLRPAHPENFVKGTHPLTKLAGILSHEEAQEIRSEKMSFSGAARYYERQNFDGR